MKLVKNGLNLKEVFVRRGLGFLTAVVLVFSITLFGLLVTSHSAEKTAEQTMEQPTEQTAVQPVEPPAEQAAEQSTQPSTSKIPEIPVKGKVTMVDIGAKKCIPCKLMAPIMEELEKEYHETGRAAIHFIDVWENKEQGRKFHIKTIPTQIFYDKDGNEFMRHEGFMRKGAIEEVLKKLGVE